MIWKQDRGFKENIVGMGVRYATQLVKTVYIVLPSSQTAQRLSPLSELICNRTRDSSQNCWIGLRYATQLVKTLGPCRHGASTLSVDKNMGQVREVNDESRGQPSVGHGSLVSTTATIQINVRFQCRIEAAFIACSSGPLMHKPAREAQRSIVSENQQQRRLQPMKPSEIRILIYQRD